MPQNNPILQAAASPQDEAVDAVASTAKLAAVNNAMEEAVSSTGEARANLEQGIGKVDAASTVIQDAIETQKENATLALMQEQIANLNAQTATIAAARAAGGLEIQTQLMSSLKDDNEKLNALLDEKADITDDKFTHIPLIDSIINGFRSVQLEEEINVAAQQVNQTSSQIQSIGAATESFARVNALSRETMNEATIQANQEILGAKYTLEAENTRIKNIATTADMYAQAARMTVQQSANQLARWRIINESEDTELKREQHKLRIEQMDMTRERWKIELPKAKADLERSQLELETARKTQPNKVVALEAQYAGAVKDYEDLVKTQEAVVTSVRQGLSSLGLPDQSEEQIVFGLRQPGATGELYRKYMLTGSNPEQSWGATPYDAAVTLTTTGANSAVENKNTDVLNAVTVLQTERYKTAQAGIPREEEQLRNDFNMTMEEYLSPMRKNIKTGDTSNPYQALPMSVLTDTATVQSTALYQKLDILKGMKEVNPQAIVDASLAGIASGTITPEQAADGISTLFTTAVNLNNRTDGGLMRIGLPPQDSYNVILKKPESVFKRLTLGANALLPNTMYSSTALGLPSGPAIVASSLISDDLPVDLTDVTKVQNVIVRYMSAMTKVDGSVVSTGAQ